MIEKGRKHACLCFCALLTLKAVSAQEEGISEREVTLNNADLPHDRHLATSYFNYNPKSSRGPSNWEKINTENHNIFNVIGESDSDDHDNTCDGRYQSPVNVKKEEKCHDDHQPGPHRGYDDFDTVDFKILPYALRADFKNPNKGNGPSIDWSNLTPSRIPAVFADVKIPAEHQLNNKKYDAELQINHYWKGNTKSPLVNLSILISDSDDKHNKYMEELIREWEEEYLKRKHDCEGKKGSYKRRHKKRSSSEMKDIWGPTTSKKADWGLYRLQTTVWYCGYKGSTTVPPCVENVRWRILDLPMKISRKQLRRMKYVLLNHRDNKCDKITVAHNGKVNRPLQKTADKMWCCTKKDYPAKEKSLWRGKFPKGYHGY